MADQISGKHESEVKVTSGYRRCAENVWFLSSLIIRVQRGPFGVNSERPKQRYEQNKMMVNGKTSAIKLQQQWNVSIGRITE